MKYKELLKQLENKTTLGNKIYYKQKGKMKSSKPKLIGKIVDEVSVMDENTEYKHFIQKIKREDGSTQYRTCYYTINGKKTGIVFGQFASEIPNIRFKELIQKVTKKKDFL